MSTIDLQEPRANLVRSYILRFDADDALRTTDQALTWLFKQCPFNRNLVDVLLKATAINSLYYTNIFAIYQVAQHIHSLDIDGQLAEGCPELVEKIACVKISGECRRNYSFASKYCSWHRPDIYPIYDNYVEELIWAYRNQDTFADFHRTELQEYPRYRDIIMSFRTHYPGLTEFGFRELDKFLWGYGREVFARRVLS